MLLVLSKMLFLTLQEQQLLWQPGVLLM